MYTIPNYKETMINLENTREGETIEDKVKRLVQEKEPVKDGAPLIFTEQKQGVNAAYNIRTDRFEIAVEAMDRVHRSKAAKREEVAKTPEKTEKDAKVIDMNKGDGKTEPLAG